MKDAGERETERVGLVNKAIIIIIIMIDKHTSIGANKTNTKRK